MRDLASTARAIWQRAAAASVIVAALAVAGCDDDPAGPDGDDSGRIDAVVMDDAASASPLLIRQGAGDLHALGGHTATRGARAPGLVAARTPGSVASRPTFFGTAQGDFQVSISSDGRTWVAVGSLNGITVDLQTTGQETYAHRQQDVPAGTYRRVRLILENADVKLSVGSVIGGITLGIDTTVSIDGGNQVVIERTVTPFTIEAGGTARLVFDLNSEGWVNESALTLGSAPANNVQASVTAGVTLLES